MDVLHIGRSIDESLFQEDFISSPSIVDLLTVEEALVNLSEEVTDQF